MGIVIQIIVLILAVIVHEVSHGYVAYKLGDPTAKTMGRLTLNPLPHIDPFWSIILPVGLILTHSPFILGGAKPVPVDWRYFKNPRRDMMFVSLAGPGSNILLAIVGLLIWKLAGLVPALQSPGLQAFIEANLIINVVLAAFNLIPVPPLDGSKVIMGLLPESMAYKYARLEPMGMIIVIILLVTGIFNMIFQPIFEFIMFLMKVFM
jgi:Zn-dependent protease